MKTTLYSNLAALGEIGSEQIAKAATKLSPSERKVLKLAAEHFKNPEIFNATALDRIETALTDSIGKIVAKLKSSDDLGGTMKAKNCFNHIGIRLGLRGDYIHSVEISSMVQEITANAETFKTIKSLKTTLQELSILMKTASEAIYTPKLVTPASFHEIIETDSSGTQLVVDSIPVPAVYGTDHPEKYVPSISKHVAILRKIIAKSSMSPEAAQPLHALATRYKKLSVSLQLLLLQPEVRSPEFKQELESLLTEDPFRDPILVKSAAKR